MATGTVSAAASTPAEKAIEGRAAAVAPAGVTKSSRWYCDLYVGTAEGLIAAGLITGEHLHPQLGRPLGRTVFLPNGEACPPRVKRWRDPGFMAVQWQEDRTYRVEITVAKDVQKQRRDAERAAECLAEQERIRGEFAAEHGLNVVPLRRDVSISNEEAQESLVQWLRDLLDDALAGRLLGMGAVLYHQDGDAPVGLVGVPRENRRLASDHFSEAARVAWPGGPTHVVERGIS